MQIAFQQQGRAPHASLRLPRLGAVKQSHKFQLQRPLRPHLCRVAAGAAKKEQQQQQQPPQQPPSAEDKAVVASVLDKASQLEASNDSDQALDLLRQELRVLQARRGWPRGARMLRQRVCHLLFSAGDYPEALREARAVSEEIAQDAGEGSGEALLFGLRHGIVEAAAGELSAGRQRIYRAGAWVVPKLQSMVQQQEEAGGQGAALPDMALRSLSATLNEANLFGSIFTIKDLAQQGKADEAVAMWESLDSGVVQCFSYLSLSMPPGAALVRNALREHDRLVAAWGRDPVLGARLRQQSTQLHGTAERIAQARA